MKTYERMREAAAEVRAGARELRRTGEGARLLGALRRHGFPAALIGTVVYRDAGAAGLDRIFVGKRKRLAMQLAAAGLDRDQVLGLGNWIADPVREPVAARWAPWTDEVRWELGPEPTAAAV